MAKTEITLGEASGLPPIDFTDFASSNADTTFVNVPAHESRSITVTKKPRYVFWAMCAEGSANYLYARYIDVVNEKTLYINKTSSATSFTIDVSSGIDGHTTITDNEISVYNWVSSSRSIAVIAVY